MKQAHLAGRTRGLRPSQQRQLERLSHRRHPDSSGADPLTLERLSDLVTELDQPLHLVLDGRGLCRVLWVGPLLGSEPLLQHLPEAPRRQAGGWRLISCSHRQALEPNRHDAVVALDLFPSTWLIFNNRPSPDGRRQAALFQPAPEQPSGWTLIEHSELRRLCSLQPNRDADVSLPPPGGTENGMERVLLLTLSTRDPALSERELSELEGLVRSAGAEPVAVIRQRSGHTNPQTLWGTGKLQEAALQVRRSQASLVITDRELTPVQARNLERLLDCPVMDRSELILDIFAQRAASAAGRLQWSWPSFAIASPGCWVVGGASRARVAASEPAVPGKPSSRRIDAPSHAASTVCSGI